MYKTYKNITNIYEDESLNKISDQTFFNDKIYPIKKFKDSFLIKTSYNYYGFIKKNDLIKESLTRMNIILTSFKFLDCPYLLGGKSVDGIDCSGFVFAVFYLNGKTIFRDSCINDYNLKKFNMKKISKEQIKPGDLIYSKGHVMLYIGNNKIIHASESNKKVLINNLNELNIKITNYITIIG